MNFQNYQQKAWQEHASQPVQVAENFTHGATLVENADQLAQLVTLITHVMGEHLGKWAGGISALQELTKHSSFNTDSAAAIARSTAALQICADEDPSLASFTLSDQVRILAVAASAIATHNAAQARELIARALDLAKTGLDREDPANRALAVTSNNLACALEEKSARTKAETEFMILAAKSARKYWEVAGTWLEISRAEYRLAMTYLSASDLILALRHAQMGAELCLENRASALDTFFAYEALALVERARTNELGFLQARERAREHFEKLSADDKTWCTASFAKLA